MKDSNGIHRMFEQWQFVWQEIAVKLATMGVLRGLKVEMRSLDLDLQLKKLDS